MENGSSLSNVKTNVGSPYDAKSLWLHLEKFVVFIGDMTQRFDDKGIHDGTD